MCIIAVCFFHVCVFVPNGKASHSFIKHNCYLPIAFWFFHIIEIQGRTCTEPLTFLQPFQGQMWLWVFVFPSDVEGGFESLNIMAHVPKPLPSLCFAPAFPVSCCSQLCVFERNVGTASVAENTSPQVF